MLNRTLRIVAGTLFCAAVAANAAEKPKPKPAPPAPAAVDPYAEVQPASETLDLAMYQRIRDEGLNHSHVMDFASALMDGIGQRLTASPNAMKANEWTRDTLTKIGLENAHLEDWGEFGLGWQQLNTWGRLVTPDPAVLMVQATPWSPSTNGAVTGDVVYVAIQDEKDFDQLSRQAGGQNCVVWRHAAGAAGGEAAVRALHGRGVGGDGRVPGERERGRDSAGDDGADAGADAADADDRQDCAVLCRREGGRGD